MFWLRKNATKYIALWLYATKLEEKLKENMMAPLWIVFANQKWNKSLLVSYRAVSMLMHYAVLPPQ